MDNAFSDLGNFSDEIEEKEENKKNQNKKEEKESEKKSSKPSPKSWSEKESYRTTITINPEIDDSYLEAKKKFRRTFKTRLTKQDAFEIGIMLLKELDPEIIEYIKNNFTPEDNIIEEIKNKLKEK